MDVKSIAGNITTIGEKDKIVILLARKLRKKLNN